MNRFVFLLFLPLLAPVMVRAAEDPVAASPEVRSLLARQDELAQRLAGMYLMRGMVEGAGLERQDVVLTREAMNANLSVLRSSLHGDPAAGEALERMATHADWLAAAVDGDSVGSYALLVADAAAGMHAETRRLAAMRQVGAGS